jgi:hypothetical protein
MDLVFDLLAFPYRRSGANLPREILDPIILYYRFITKNPWLLIFVMLVAAVSLIAEVLFNIVPTWVGYSSIAMFAAIFLLSSLRIIPTAQRLASGRYAEDKQTRLAHSMFPAHILILILVLALAMLQFKTSAGSVPRTLSHIF